MRVWRGFIGMKLNANDSFLANWLAVRCARVLWPSTVPMFLLFFFSMARLNFMSSFDVPTQDSHSTKNCRKG